MRTVRSHAAAASFSYGRNGPITSGAIRVRRPAALAAASFLFRRPATLLPLWLFGAALVVFAATRLSGSLAEPPPVMPAYGPFQRIEAGVPRPVTVSAPLPGSYVVEEGDNLSDLADELESSVDALMLANELDDLNLLEVGRELV